MSARIIIEKDGERYVANDLTVRLIDGDRWLCVENKISNCYVASTFTKLTPVIRTDNSAVIARLEAENAKLRDEILKVIAARNELLDLNRDCCDENEKLREALKDVLDVHLCDGGTTPVSDALCAVRKAQAIMKGGVE